MEILVPLDKENNFMKALIEKFCEILKIQKAMEALGKEKNWALEAKDWAMEALEKEKER